MKLLPVLGACLAMAGCVEEEVSRDAADAAFYPVHVGASGRYLSSGVSVSLAEAMDWGMRAPLVRGGQEVSTGMGGVVLQRLRYDDYEMVLVEPAVTAGVMRLGADVAGPVERETGCRLAAFDKAPDEVLVRRKVLPLEC